jgi:hypothetical protein
LPPHAASRRSLLSRHDADADHNTIEIKRAVTGQLPHWQSARVAEVQALLDDHTAGGKHPAADVIAKAQTVHSEAALLRAMFDVGYFPPNTPPPD